MLSRLDKIARDRSLSGLEVLTRPIDGLSLPPASADLIVTSYALHHLRDVDKQRIVADAYHWLRPGGTLVVADMMFGRGATSRDRAIIKAKVRVLARRGIGGWWRIAKNSYRYLLRVKQHPVAIGSGRPSSPGPVSPELPHRGSSTAAWSPASGRCLRLPAQRGPAEGPFPF